MDRFTIFVNEVLKSEGGYVNDPADSGGETICGVCRKNFPTLPVWKRLDTCRTLAEKKALRLTDAELSGIKSVYKSQYYDRCKCDAIASAAVAFQVFDMAVNAGVARACKMLQKVVGATQDGVIGPATIAKVNGSIYNVAWEFLAQREAYYRTIGVGKNAKFLRGWLNRAQKAYAFGKEVQA